MARGGVYYEPDNLTFAQARTQLVQDVDHWARRHAAEFGYVYKVGISSFIQREHQRYDHSDVAKIIADLKRDRGWVEDREGRLYPEAATARDPQRDLPKDLSKLTRAQTTRIVAYLASEPLAELRRRQAFVFRQQRAAHRTGNTRALKDLQIMEEHLAIAIDQKMFASQRRRSPRRRST